MTDKPPSELAKQLVSDIITYLVGRGVRIDGVLTHTGIDKLADFISTAGLAELEAERDEARGKLAQIRGYVNRHTTEAERSGDG